MSDTFRVRSGGGEPEFPAQLAKDCQFGFVEACHRENQSLHMLREERGEPCLTGFRQRRKGNTSVSRLAKCVAG